MRLTLLLTSAALSAAATTKCAPTKMENLVTFGDSYTDESRLKYFIDHNGQAPPPGTLLPPSNQTSSGGKAWGRFVAEATGARYYNYAVAGAMCSDKVSKHYFDNGTFPPVKEYQAPAYQADVKFNSLYPNRKPENTVYAQWIGTNDLGIDGFLSDKQEPGKSLPDFVECVWETFDAVYQTGGRRFVLLNQAPLQVSPMYAAPKNGGEQLDQYWPNKASACNSTESEQKMFEYTMSVNTMFDYGAPFQLLVKKRWPGAYFTIFNVHDLMLDIHNNPSQYLTPPAVVDKPYRTCGANGCVDAKDPLSGYLWFDGLHPSERTDQIIATNFVDVVKGSSKYGTYYH
ncbi:hypothetical protein VHEMI03436 [[Torrubiella] hemipterigena]|uniref:Acetyl esterase n=1 Tax=[Torrubiella] hemipterigena TaxID=1531966 RepID=A0A0A1TAS6_9HYPO|nr:hypothetical protein VHEMI03436 [[Torrubiella] hemipterigena]